MTVHDHVVEAAGQLAEAGIAPAEARRDAEVLARATLGWTRARFLTDRRDEAPADFRVGYSDRVARRLEREPVAYITGTKEFWGLEFTVTASVLIPRPETELLVEQSLRCLGQHGLSPADASPPFVVDVGTGSGCLAISLATERPVLRLAATDISQAALEIARQNATRHQVNARIDFLLGSYLEPVSGDPDLIVSNPPYIEIGAWLAPEVGGHEPATALFAGVDGLEAIRALVSQAAVRLKPGGSLVFEFGLAQEEAVRELLGRSSFRLERCVPDLQGIPRVVVASRL